MLFLSTLFSFANPLPEPIEYKKHDYENELKNNFFRVTSYDEMYNVTLEKVMYRGLIIDNRISDIVKFDIDEYSSVADYHELEIIDHCAHPGTYFYISDLDCTEFINEFNSLQCRNYAVIVHEIPFYENSCDQSRYTSVDLSEDEIESMKTETSGGGSSFVLDTEEINFGEVEVGSSIEKEIIVTNVSEQFKGTPYYSISDCYEDYEDNSDDKACFKIIKSPGLLNPKEKGSLVIRFEPLEGKEYDTPLCNYWSYTNLMILRGVGISVVEDKEDGDNDSDYEKKSSAGCSMLIN